MVKIMSKLIAKKKHASTSTKPGRKTFALKKEDFAKDEKHSIKMINGYMEGQQKLLTKLESDQEFKNALAIAVPATIYCENPVQVISEMNKLFHNEKPKEKQLKRLKVRKLSSPYKTNKGKMAGAQLAKP